MVSVTAFEHGDIVQRDASPGAQGSWALSQSSARYPAESWFWGFCILGALTILVPFELLHRVPQLDVGLPILLKLLLRSLFSHHRLRATSTGSTYL